MITITDLAVEKAKEILSAEGKSHWGIRLYIAGSSCCGPSYGMDLDENPAKDDHVIEKNGVKLFMDKATSEKLSGLQINYVNEGDQQGFVITGNQPSSCSSGCGGSCE
ncbi:MAG: iron-sulfur cluster assembly accessory protein [Nitrospirae bacterium]|nr:iron-sulfur cluster assembly accessory protein [Nitrospirota bacterium]